ncbi:PPR domain-containing protein/PPR_2 domain-containing protein/DYW_deaminase domain-containing protein [Cephalotus follicularis]|uniref:PPR domain-containing protein/PPR_2 domain-containing protein/DYW_deaminase domain-containing protein n=1 Tax=Cephalotus follicularis TaxID=3775 RepID=A0A1Q3CVP2_CEPFO|nr:PPR domain-containing protein/PPR_2 domain-containing protein/DYW_deaminase domain-containing protein [Cephalotus follicularis]
MDKLALTHHHHHHHFNHNSSLHQKPVVAHKPKSRNCSLTCLPLAFETTTTTLSTSLQSSNPFLPSSFFHSFNDFSEIKSLDSVKAMHAHMMKKMSNKWDYETMAKSLISSYLTFGDFNSAAMVFFVGFERSYLVWNSFLEAFESLGGETHEVLQVFGDLYSRGVVFDSRVLTVVLKVCASVMDSWLGLEIHAGLIKRGFDMDVYLRCALMSFYGRCWGLESANQVFHEMSGPKDLLWNEAILINLRGERWAKAIELYREMQFSLLIANTTTVVKMLQACGKVGALNQGKQIHGYVLRFGLESNLLICNCLITLYSKNGKLELARKVFSSMEIHNLSSWNSIISSHTAFGHLNDALYLLHKMESSAIKPDIITWNCLLSGHALHGLFEEVLSIWQRMQDVGFRPNSSSVTSILQAVIESRLLSFGKEIHGYAIRNGLDDNMYVGTSLLDMYLKNDCLADAKAAFNYMKKRNIFAWNSLISGYSYRGLFGDAKKLLNQMEEEGFKPDLVTWNGLVSGYSMWGHGDEALATIHQIKSSGLTPNVVSWTAMISGSSQKGDYRKSLEFFMQMQQEDIKPNAATISSLLQACGGLSLLQKGKEIHCLTLKTGFIEDVYVATTLIDTYSKSGNLKMACEVFRKIQNKTLACCNCMIMGFAIYGLGKEAILLFNEMCGAGIRPDAITFTALLSGCKNSSLVDEGWKYFDAMSTDYKIIPSIEHYSCMVDLLGRAGYLDEAWDFIKIMPLKPDASIWGALLGSCRIHKSMEYADIAAKELIKLEPYNSANYVLMMHLYSMSNRWDDVGRLKDLMREKGLKNGHTWSWIQIDRRVHVFSTEDTPHPDEGEIYFELYQLISEMKKFGYVPEVNCVYQNINEVEKEKVLMSHTEKLAITYGLMKTKSSAPIKVIKNTRVCSDCHTAAKYMSVVRNREIFLRDGIRFHHFREGKCSCNDCW